MSYSPQLAQLSALRTNSCAYGEASWTGQTSSGKQNEEKSDNWSNTFKILLYCIPGLLSMAALLYSSVTCVCFEVPLLGSLMSKPPDGMQWHSHEPTMISLMKLQLINLSDG